MKASGVKRPKRVESADNIMLDDLPSHAVESTTEPIRAWCAIWRQFLDGCPNLFLGKADVEARQVKLRQQSGELDQVLALKTACLGYRCSTHKRDQTLPHPPRTRHLFFSSRIARALRIISLRRERVQQLTDKTKPDKKQTGKRRENE